MPVLQFPFRDQDVYSFLPSNVYMCTLIKTKSLILPVGDVFHVADGIIDATFLSAQDDSVEVSVHHSGAETLELRNQPDESKKVHRYIY